MGSRIGVHLSASKSGLRPILQCLREKVIHFSPNERRYLYSFNALDPPYETSCELCQPYLVWKRERDGDFFTTFVGGEPLRQYRIGGYHPVDFGDTLVEGKYSIVTKLGWGRDAITWLAQDLRCSRLVAIKVFRSEISTSEKVEEEAAILRKLAIGPANHPGKKHVPQLLDRFNIEGPNGRHSCLVFEALGPEITPYRFRLAPTDRWKLARQVAQGVSYMHDMGVAHGDLRFDKLLFANARFLHKAGDRNQPLEIGYVSAIQPVDESYTVAPIYAATKSRHVPRYLMADPLEISSKSISFSENSDHTTNDYNVRIVGFGLRRMVEKQEMFDGIKRLEYVAPEVFLNFQLTPSADIWSLACVIFQLMTDSRPLGRHSSKGTMLKQWHRVFGQLPEEWASHMTQSAKIDHEHDEFDTNMASEVKSTLREPHRTTWFSEDNIASLCDLLTWMTQYRPSERPSVAEVLKHPWFQHEPSLAPTHENSGDRSQNIAKLQ